MRSRLAALALAAAATTLLGGCGLIIPATEQLSKVDEADDLQAKADLAAAKLAFVSFEIDSMMTPPTTAAQLADFGYSKSEGASLVRIFPGSTSAGLCLDVQSSTGTFFKIMTTGTAVDGECAASDL